MTTLSLTEERTHTRLMKNDSALDNLTETLQSFDLTALIWGANGWVNLELLFKQELANRGLDSTGKWVGFELAYEELFDERQLAELEIYAEEELQRAKRGGDKGRAKSALGRLDAIRRALLKKQSARKFAEVTARKARQARDARFEAATAA